MKIKNGKEQDFDIYIKTNSNDFYSIGVVDYINRWADLMEHEIEQGMNLEDIAEETSLEADTDGITGFQYGCAVTALSEFWEYGEELGRWHNAKYNYNGDGIVNPAVLQF